MAKTKDSTGKTKTEHVREALAANPKAGGKEILAILAANGIRVAPSLLYFIKSKAKQKQRIAKRAQVAETTRQTGAPNPLEVVIRVKNLARELGGIKNLKLLVELLAE